jgi:hypothetical protein
VERFGVGGGTVAMIGVDDLYLDRLRQSTANTIDTSVEFRSALAVAAGAFEWIDRRYVLRRIRDIERREPSVGRLMRNLDSRIRRRVRAVLANEALP